MKLICTRGLPASGKTTWAKQEELDYALHAEGVFLICKDDIREELHAGSFSKENEKEVVEYERNKVEQYMRMNFPYIIVHNTHLGTRNRHISFYEGLAHKYGYEFEVKDFDTPVYECIARDALREKPVGAERIWEMYLQTQKQDQKNETKSVNNGKIPCYVFDIDGTIALMNGRSPYEYTKVHTDIPNMPVVNILRMVYNLGFPVLLVSGRPSDCMVLTKAWLQKEDIPYTELLMRNKGDTRNDSIVKREIYEELIAPRFDVQAVFDDRTRVVKVWRDELKLPCFQCFWGDF